MDRLLIKTHSRYAYRKFYTNFLIDILLPLMSKLYIFNALILVLYALGKTTDVNLREF